MKSFWSFAAKVLFVIAIIQAWFLYDFYQQNTTISALNEEYAQYLKDSEAKISQLEEQLAETEKKTVDGILKETNKAVVQGWESLLDKVEQELEKAREAVPELLELEPEALTPDTNSPEVITPESTPKTSPSDETETEEKNSEAPPVLIPGEMT